ncbi:MAG TPA: phytanoyl-CoA dioxygenase family protein [Kofleriaceae bacterium]|nr:phytanoyl-CoA dioxygenase family protein [Kofleriaceae bacterium]
MDRSTGEAIATFLDRGYCTIEDGLSGARLHRVRTDFFDHFEAKRRRSRIRPAGPPEQGEHSFHGSHGKGGNHGYNRWNALLPSTSTFLADDVVANPRVLGVLEGIRRHLGDHRRWVLTLIGSDVNLPDSSDQPPHRDGRSFVVTVNCPLIDVGPENGPLEVWPGTHRPPGAPFGLQDMAISKEEWAELRRGPSRRFAVPAGTFIIRDQRMLHRGTANGSDQVRPMLSLYYSLMGSDDVVAHRSLLDIGSGTARALRRAGQRLPLAGSIQRHVLLADGEALGLAMIYLAGSDRRGHLRIPRPIWESLSEPARQLLRFASVDRVVTEAYRKHRSAGRTKEACAVLARSLVRVTRRLITPPTVPTSS